MQNTFRKPELLLPAGSPDVLRTAIDYGADAVYLGGEAFGLRAMAKNFSAEEMAEGIAYAHARGKKVYVTVNILAHNEDLEEADAYLAFLAQLKPDALLVADPGLFVRARRICPDLPIHISTQANNGSRRTWRSKPLFTAPCAFPIPEDASSAAFSPGATRTAEPAPIPAAGNTPLWRKSGRDSTFRWRKMREGPIFSTRRTSA